MLSVLPLRTAHSLGLQGDVASADLLIGWLRDPDWGIRAYAARALGEIGDERAAAELILVLSDSSSAVRVAATRALGQVTVT